MTTDLAPAAIADTLRRLLDYTAALEEVCLPADASDGPSHPDVLAAKQLLAALTTPQRTQADQAA